MYLFGHQVNLIIQIIYLLFSVLKYLLSIPPFKLIMPLVTITYITFFRSQDYCIFKYDEHFSIFHSNF